MNPANHKRAFHSHTKKIFQKMTTMISTMVGDIDAGELDWGNEEEQVKKCIDPIDDSKHNIRVAG
jgi:hypothetical protein